MELNSSNPSLHHVILFPFMSKGHTVPLLHLARLLLRRTNVAITIFTTPGNHSFIAQFLSDTNVSIIDLLYPENISEIPAGVESTDQLPYISLYVQFAEATKLMQPAFERELQCLPPVSFMVSDGFLWWTLESASKFGFPRFVFYGMGAYAMSVSKVAMENRVLIGVEKDDERVELPHFPWIKLRKNEFGPLFSDPKGPEFEFIIKHLTAASNSYGMIINSFQELESVFVDYCIREAKPKAWCIGPLCLAKPLAINDTKTRSKPIWIQWLDQKLGQGSPVLYVSFGTQAEISMEQIKEVAIGLEESKVNFLWVIRKEEWEVGEGFEERVKERGIVVREWVDQREILLHQSVKGFLSHCGWNSVLESICAGVPILAWPMMAEQPLNAKMVEEEIKVGLRVDSCYGDFVKWEELQKKVRELMEGENYKELRKNVIELSEVAKKAMEEEKGLSWRTLDTLIAEACNFH
ncbi:UDP-glycosyltransferase 90A1-like [Mangifera indica]|uniref:UDP-glycosyltransferase 90A1-like n=1 Tax=Mangifera indica TaxID=29780 RepID=UPI001CF9C009|nr:UDP-glycosyltransferase 90A1-like [Mangifera indica]